ncbi:hypothetical protein [Dermabacter hominis]|uniref:hypothetical protein n=1 Tax=Dermabacter hominis TaxID=36740 RepID=UPI002431EAC3|nr:hypothetical protein [Dermabacter hominis]
MSFVPFVARGLPTKAYFCTLTTRNSAGVLGRQRKAAFANPPIGPNQNQHDVMAAVELALAEAEAMLGSGKLIA